jgi:hypothetical protein
MKLALVNLKRKLLGNQVPALTRAQSQARVRKLRRAGCKVQTRVLPDGTRVVLKRCPRGARIRSNPHPLAGAGNWVPASGGTERPFLTRTGRRLQYVWQPRTRAHAYYDLDRDIILSDEEAQQALGFALLANQRRLPRFRVKVTGAENGQLNALASSYGGKKISTGLGMFGDYDVEYGFRKSQNAQNFARAARAKGLKATYEDFEQEVGEVQALLKRIGRRESGLLDNQTPAPNIIGYAMLAGFAALALYAIFRPRPAAAAITPSAVLPGGCKIETTEDFARLETWATRKGIAVVYLPGTNVPPSPESSDLARSFVRAGTNPVYVVVTSDGKFWTYDKGKPLQSSVYREDFCNFRPGQIGQISWLN